MGPVVPIVIGGAAIVAGGAFELIKRARASKAATVATANAATVKPAAGGSPVVSQAIQQSNANASPVAQAALQAAANATNQQAATSSNAQIAVQLLADPATVNAMTQAVGLPFDRLDAITAANSTTVEAMLTVSLDANPGADTTAVAVSVAQTIAAMA